MVLFTNDSASEEAIYIFTKTVAENEERFKKSYGAFKNWRPENMVENLNVTIHEGAIRYYKERGWMQGMK